MKFKNIPNLRACTLIAIVSFIGCAEAQKENQTPWVALFDGESLDGWSIKGGDARYEIRDGAIVGSTVRNTPNTFLTTNKIYSDFILELEYKVDSSMNSGIQIRSNSFDHYMNGRVHGYQVEIDPSSRAWSAGIYDEARRGWLVPLTNNPDAQQAFKQNDWNAYRIEAIGDTIKTWINGVAAAHLIDDKTSSGFIALQVHSIDNNAEEGTEIQWKNVKILTEDLAKYSMESTVTPLSTKNKLTIDESKNGWKLLWDGETTSGWRGAKLEEFPAEGWIIENGELIVLESGGGESTAGGDIVTTQIYGDFELVFDFKITEGANSGVKYYVDTNINKGEGSSIGLEYQILDDKVHPDAQLGNHSGSRTMASLYDLIPANQDKPVNPIGEWNTGKIVSKDNTVEHWINGAKVLEYERKSQNYRNRVKNSKYEQYKNFGERETGQILLQDHGDRVAFKNVKIKS